MSSLKIACALHAHDIDRLLAIAVKQIGTLDLQVRRALTLQ
jgi:hypothetical protein